VEENKGRRFFRRRDRNEGDSFEVKVVLREGETADSLVKRFKWAVEASGVLKEVRDREYAMSPSEKVKFKRRRAAKRRNKSRQDRDEG
jgi:small subunit ribosomal protein S21